MRLDRFRGVHQTKIYILNWEMNIETPVYENHLFSSLLMPFQCSISQTVKIAFLLIKFEQYIRT